MKIHLVTWLGTGNFGTSLQSYALHRKLAEMNYDVSFLPYFDVSDFSLQRKIKKVIILPLVFAKFLLKKIFYETTKQRKIRLFNKSNYNIYAVTTKNQFDKLLQETDVFITGSDQIWNCYHSFKPFYFLSFAGKVKRVAYASSVGTADFPKNNRVEVQTLLSNFKHIGVREKTAADLIGNLLNRKDIRQVVDPTFLLDKTHWQRFADKAEIEFALPKTYILCYFVGDKSCTEKQLEEVQQRLGITNTIIIPALENSNIQFSNAHIYTDAGPYEFVKLISNAACICTDSFHATAISIIMQKDFIEFLRFKDDDKKSQNSRIYDVLNHYGLFNRLYNSNNTQLYNQIDYLNVNKIVEADREDCSAYLKNAIEH